MKRLPPNRYGVPAAVHSQTFYRPTGPPHSQSCHAEPSHYYLKPGELFVGEESVRVETLLGSCVSVTLFSPKYRLGAVCHCLLPSCRCYPPCLDDCHDGARFVDCAIWQMLDWFLRRGIGRREIQAKLFGGADLLTVVKGNPAHRIGQQNIEQAMHILDEEGILLVAADVGGLRGRKIIFKTYTGEVFMKRLSRTGIT